MSLKGENIQAFTADQVCQLTGNTRGQLSYWDKTDFFNPRFTHPSPRYPYRRIYSFRDVVGLRAIAQLRNEKSVSLQELRRVGNYLNDNYKTPWSSLKFYVFNRKVYFQETGSDIAYQAKEYGQGDYIIVDLESVAKEVNDRIINFRRPHGEVSKDRYIVRNDSVIKGTRIRTAAIWNFHNAGYSLSKIKKEFPGITKNDIKAAIEFELLARKAA